MVDWCECDWLLNNTIKSNNSLSKFLSELKFMSISKTSISKCYKYTCFSKFWFGCKFETIWSNCNWINFFWKFISYNASIVCSLTNTHSSLTNSTECGFWCIQKFFTSIEEMIWICKQTSYIINLDCI